MKNSMLTMTTLASILMILFIQMTETDKKNISKKSSFECGFDPMSMKKMTFSTNFLMLMMMFLIFDIEISLLIPFINMSMNMMKTIKMMFLTLIILLTALMMKEWSQGCLEWNQ